MKEIIILTILAGLLLLGFIATLTLGLIRKKRILIIISMVTLLLAIACGGRAGYLFVSKSYQRLKYKPRTGMEIYSALFGKPGSNCVNVINHQDQVVPKIDYAIWLEFETCPEELNRILNLQPFQAEKVATKGKVLKQPSACDWFKPESLGDSIWVFTYKKGEYGNGQTIYSSLDSTKVFCVDVWD